MPPLISIVIPSNNKTELLDRAVQSIVSDVGWDATFEICISDNSSSDTTGQLILEKWSHRSDITYRRSLDALSLDENVNMAVTIGSGEYTWIFGDDDVLAPKFLEYLKNYLMQHKPDILIINSSSFDDDGVIEQHRHVMQDVKIYDGND
ncbi:MAG: glycosyltransferase family A protein, partial [Bacteroidota bacterium]